MLAFAEAVKRLLTGKPDTLEVEEMLALYATWQRDGIFIVARQPYTLLRTAKRDRTGIRRDQGGEVLPIDLVWS